MVGAVSKYGTAHAGRQLVVQETHTVWGERLGKERRPLGLGNGICSRLSLLIHIDDERTRAAPGFPDFPAPSPPSPTKAQRGKQREAESGGWWWVGGLVLQGIGEEFVHLRDAGRDAEVDCAVADLDDEAAEDLGVDLDVAFA